jgi:hypothetical protein
MKYNEKPLNIPTGAHNLKVRGSNPLPATMVRREKCPLLEGIFFAHHSQFMIGFEESPALRCDEQEHFKGEWPTRSE